MEVGLKQGVIIIRKNLTKIRTFSERLLSVSVCPRCAGSADLLRRAASKPDLPETGSHVGPSCVCCGMVAELVPIGVGPASPAVV